MGDIRSDTQPAFEPREEDGEREITVLVTGFGPFLAQLPINPSYEIALRLPTSLPPSPSSPIPSLKVRLIKHPTPVKVAYQPVSTLIPSLLSTHSPDIVLHIGLAAGRSYYTIEKSSQRLGYVRNKDVEGKRWEAEESDLVWPRNKGFPERLQTGLPFEDVWRRWREGCEKLEGIGNGEGDVEVRPSDDVGTFLCGFIYYTSLAWFWARKKGKGKDGNEEGGSGEGEEELAEEEAEEEAEMPVLFLHVPSCPQEKDLQRGTKITVALIRSMVDSWVAQKKGNGEWR